MPRRDDGRARSHEVVPARSEAGYGAPPARRDEPPSIAEVRYQIEETRRRIRRDVVDLEAALRRNLDPRRRFQDSPFPMLLAALLLGFWIGLGRRRPGVLTT